MSPRVPGIHPVWWKQFDKATKKRLTAEYEAKLKAEPSHPAAPAYRVAKRRVIELCADPNSELGSARFQTSECEVVRVTESDDLLSPEGLDKAMSAANCPNPLLMVSLPCTGGSNWQQVHLTTPHGRKRVKEHTKKFLRLLAAADKVAEVVSANAGTICVRATALECILAA